MTTSQQTPAQPPAERPAGTPHPVRFGRVAAAVQVTDLDRALAFYVGVLGFEKVFENGDPVGFVILEKDAAELHLDLDPTHRANARNVAHLMVEDANALYEHLIANGVRIVKGIRDADYGMRTFVLADPDGNRVDVGQDL
ncbi:VOC family protein [Kineosporia sp. R_H_3]|uniref:bleomycin resistance protein n=1 Tax=Kineosporia sp. R_H_3 TaxID=1961848 RepID=UPI000B4BDAF2|nr:VOC family protein [Kineosporia sp. R_H_3]